MRKKALGQILGIVMTVPVAEEGVNGLPVKPAQGIQRRGRCGRIGLRREHEAPARHLKGRAARASAGRFSGGRLVGLGIAHRRKLVSLAANLQASGCIWVRLPGTSEFPEAEAERGRGDGGSKRGQTTKRGQTITMTWLAGYTCGCLGRAASVPHRISRCQLPRHESWRSPGGHLPR